MGITANSVNLVQYQVLEIPETGDSAEWARPLLEANAFASIDNSTEESAIGWATIDDPMNADFTDPRDFFRSPYLCFTLRQDRRRVPSALLRRRLKEAEAEFLSSHPTQLRVPKQKREELRESVHNSLLARTLPTPSTFDIAWNVERGLLFFTGTSSRAIEAFEGLFRQTFPELRLVARHPFAHARSVVNPDLQDTLEDLNQAATDAVVEMTEANAWLGQDFLYWLLYATVEGRDRFKVNQDGPAVRDELFTAFLDNRLVLTGLGDHGPQKITVAGPQENFSEVRAALARGKAISEATIHFEKMENEWKTNLKSEPFYFGSFKGPAVKLEKDEITDEKSEHEAVFFEKMHVLEEGMQLFDSLLAAFLRERLAEDWSARSEEMKAQLLSETSV